MQKASRGFFRIAANHFKDCLLYHRSLYIHNNQWIQTEDTSNLGTYILKLISKAILVSAPRSFN